MNKRDIGKEGGFFKIDEDGTIIKINQPSSQQPDPQKPNGIYYPLGTQLFIKQEFKGYGLISYNDESGQSVRGFIRMSDLQRTIDYK
jgi:hypothetical protein